MALALHRLARFPTRKVPTSFPPRSMSTATLQIALPALGKSIACPTGLFINNQFVPSLDSKETLPCVNPSTEEAIGSVVAGLTFGICALNQSSLFSGPYSFGPRHRCCSQSCSHSIQDRLGKKRHWFREISPYQQAGRSHGKRRSGTR